MALTGTFQLFLHHTVWNVQHHGQERGGCGVQGLSHHNTVLKASGGGHLACTGDVRPLCRGPSGCGDHVPGSQGIVMVCHSHALATPHSTTESHTPYSMHNGLPRPKGTESGLVCLGTIPWERLFCLQAHDLATKGMPPLGTPPLPLPWEAFVQHTAGVPKQHTQGLFSSTWLWQSTCRTSGNKGGFPTFPYP